MGEAGRLRWSFKVYNIGTMYLDGEGVPIDTNRGLALIHEAADHGELLAQSLLMQAYAAGYHDLPIDEVAAAYWREKYDAQAPESDD